MAHPTTKTPRKQQSVWLMLGGAMLISVFGWAGIVRQSEGPLQNDTSPIELAVVELPVPQSSSRGVIAQAPVTANRTTDAAPLRHVTRPVLHTHSSN
jgi:hypothetical protein